MTKRKKKAPDKPATPCVLCGSTDWCNCEWDSFVPSPFVCAGTPTRPRRHSESDVAPRPPKPAEQADTENTEATPAE